MKKIYKNWFVHNMIGHPLSEVAYWLFLLFGAKRAFEISGQIHDATLPVDHLNGRG